MIEVEPLKSRIASLLSRSSVYRKQAHAEAAEIEQIRAQVALAKGRLALGDEMGAVFDALQNRALLRSVGAFEKLLSAIMHDVVPDTKDSAIKLVPEYKAGTTWLDVLVSKPEGVEDLYDANGGSMTNVASVGLLYAALSRTKNRPFMVLDEPDCWLNPDYVPEFVSVVAQVAKRYQTVYITHHPLPEPNGQFTEVVLKRGPSGKIVASYDPATAPKWEDSMPGIRAIELENFRSHEHTSIPLFPGMTVVGGANNLGKSNAVVGALRAVCYGESPESVIRHKQKSAKVRLHLENGQIVEWVRQRDKSPAVTYSLHKDGELVEQGRAPKRGAIPDWVSDVLGIRLVDDMDIQLRNQKEPVFLLNDTASKRAQILSVGKESGHLVKMMQAYKRQNQEDLDTVRVGELSVMRMSYRQNVLKPIDDINDDMVEASLEIDDWASKVERCNQLEASLNTLQRMADFQARIHALEEQGSNLELPALPVVADTQPLQDIVDALQKGSPLQELKVPGLPELPQISDTTKLIELGVALSRGQRIQGLQLPALPELSGIVTREELAQSAERTLAALQEASKSMAEMSEQEKQSAAQELQAREALQTLQKELGHCPLCNAQFELTTEHTHHEATI